MTESPRWLSLVIAAIATTAAMAVQEKPTVSEVRTLTHASRDSTDLLLDLDLPPAPVRRPIPVIVFLHGGGCVVFTVAREFFRRHLQAH